MKKWRLPVLLFLLTTLTAHAQTTFCTTAKTTTIIDVRSPTEFAAGHIPKAINIPVDQLATGTHTPKSLNKQSPILLYCQSGRRSTQAHASLTKQGFSNVTDGGGIVPFSAQLQACGNRR